MCVCNLVVGVLLCITGKPVEKEWLRVKPLPMDRSRLLSVHWLEFVRTF